MINSLLQISLDLCTNLTAQDRYRRLIDAVTQIVPCNASALLRLDQGVLVPVVVAGLQPDVVGRRFVPAEHPRLKRILEARGTVRFDYAEGLPDPFDGLLASGSDALSNVHACMGCPLIVEGVTVGVLTIDAFDLHAFDRVKDEELATLAALAGAAMRTADLIGALEHAATRQGLVARQLLRDARVRGGVELLGTSAPTRRVREEIELLGESDLTVLITGETGVGKEIVSRSIHAHSARRDQPLIYVNCAALPESIAESELFGHTRGAFTGAHENRMGKFEVADGGTLFLDEIGELPLSIQPKLLRALQSGEVQRVGSEKSLHVNVRVLAATNRDIVEEVRAGRFRADLYHRLSVYPLHIPPLRDRRDDIPLLAGHFLDAACKRLGLGTVRLGNAARAALMAYEWPGNVRELEHVLLRASLRASGGKRHALILLDREHLGAEFGEQSLHTAEALPVPGAVIPPTRLELASAGPVPGTGVGLSGSVSVAPTGIEGELPLSEAVDLFRTRYVQEIVQRSNGNWAEAARRLQMDRGNLHRLAQRLGLL